MVELNWPGNLSADGFYFSGYFESSIVCFSSFFLEFWRDSVWRGSGAGPAIWTSEFPHDVPDGLEFPCFFFGLPNIFGIFEKFSRF